MFELYQVVLSAQLLPWEGSNWKEPLLSTVVHSFWTEFLKPPGSPQSRERKGKGDVQQRWNVHCSLRSQVTSVLLLHIFVPYSSNRMAASFSESPNAMGFKTPHLPALAGAGSSAEFSCSNLLFSFRVLVGSWNCISLPLHLCYAFLPCSSSLPSLPPFLPFFAPN